MPGRVLPGTLSALNLKEVGDFFRRIAAFFDDPITGTIIAFGAYDSGTFSRRCTITVVDRGLERYSPSLFRNKAGKRPGRWLVHVYGANTEHGAPVAISPAMAKGRLLSTLPGDIYLMATDSSGVIEFDWVKTISFFELSEGLTDGWVHAAVVGLLRSEGIGWSTGAEPTGGTVPTDPVIS